jgi:hypothetical protein
MSPQQNQLDEFILGLGVNFYGVEGELMDVSRRGFRQPQKWKGRRSAQETEF